MANLNLTARFGIDGRGFKSGLDRVSNQTRAFVTGIGSKFVGLFGTAAITNAFKGVIENAGKVRDAATGLGLTVEQFQQLDFAAKQSGTSIEVLAKALQKTAQAQQNALEGQLTYVKTFERLGISAERLKSSSPQQLFMHIAEQVKSGAIGTQNMADMMELLGRNAAPVLAVMQEDLSGVIKQFDDLNLAISDETIEVLANLGDEWTTVTTGIKKDLAEIAIGAINVFKRFTDGIGMATTAWGSFFGTLAGGGGFNEALDEAAKDMMEEGDRRLQQRANEQAAIQNKARERRERAERGDILAMEAAGDIEKTTKGATRTVTAKMASDQLARIGGFTGAESKTVSLAQKNNKTLEQIRRALEVNGIFIKGSI